MTGAAITGIRQGATSKVRCVEVAALVAAAILRQNPQAEILPFDQVVVELKLNPRDSVMTNAQKLASIGGGGTNCSAPLQRLNAMQAAGEMIIFVSDNQSWLDAVAKSQGTAMLREWHAFKVRNPAARLVCLDIQPYTTTQAYDRADVLNIGGFSDQVFQVIADFAADKLHPEHWVGMIEQVSL
jgi:60 kDa SS-A/Ro ribonucleoprotein